MSLKSGANSRAPEYVQACTGGRRSVQAKLRGNGMRPDFDISGTIVSTPNLESEQSNAMEPDQTCDLMRKANSKCPRFRVDIGRSEHAQPRTNEEMAMLEVLGVVALDPVRARPCKRRETPRAV